MDAAVKFAGNLRGRRNKDGSVSFVCDDCGVMHTYSLSLRRRSEPVVEPADRRPWSLTQRKQRCADCTVIAKEKGWVK